ncbi:MAG: Asp-tRNA(Asn)/Glu-tRNA(Gln) amidotransferase subunit GatA [Chloroflexi bacterium]|nr:Asp-tRNA(Asn)/Glu-tRNA(Gln) amidotransferase subunit GatA [Chloroflexota bacterium]
MTTTDIARLSITEAAALIRKRKLSPVELTESCLQRIGSLDARLRAFITVTREDALATAHQAATAIAGGNYKGPLHGIPFALKDLFDTAGVLTTAGSKIMAERVPQEDAEATARLKAAGAILLGKLNMHEFAFGITGVNPHYGGTYNPWDTTRMSGGSSSGAGAAIASAMTLGALGTDTGGSIRAPASLCGITGLKPTYGRVSRRGIVPLSWALDHAGPMARSAADAAIILKVIAGHDPHDETSSEEPVPDYTEALKDRRLKRLRIGVPQEYFFDNVDDEVLKAIHAAILVLRDDLKAEVSEVSLPHIAEAPAAVSAIMLPEALAYHKRWLAERPQDYGEDVRARLEMGLLYPAVSYVQAQRFRSLIVEEWRQKVFDRVDLLAVPTTPVPAPSLDENDLQTTLTLTRFTGPFNLTGLPAISIPCGFTNGGLPIGLQLVGRWWDEATVLRAAHAYQQATDWHTRAPPL